jgi:hypothetical protein
MTLHYELNHQEHAAVSAAKRNGAQFDRPEMLCRTGDGRANGTRHWDHVTCQRCLQAGQSSHLERKRADIARIEGRHGYCAEAVQQAIEASNRAGRRIGKREQTLIHRLLKGR